MTYKKHWIPVSVSPGMFSNEYAILVKLITGELVSLFADKCLVKEVDGHPWLKVYQVESDPAQQRQRVLLPSETFETGTRWVEVAI